MVQDKLNPLARRDKPEPLFRRLMLRSFTRLLSKTTSLAEINNVSQKELTYSTSFHRLILMRWRLLAQTEGSPG